MSEAAFLEKLERSPLHGRVYQRLRQAILTAEFEPGQRLTVRMLASSLGISTMPVRAALSRLAAERALHVMPNGTAMVPVLTREEFEHLVDLRLLLEGTAVEKASCAISSKVITKLRRLVRRLEQVFGNSDPAGYIKTRCELQLAVYQSGGCPALVDLIDRVWVQIAPFQRFGVQDVGSRVRPEDYGTMIAALERRDGKAARGQIETFIRKNAELILQTADFR